MEEKKVTGGKRKRKELSKSNQSKRNGSDWTKFDYKMKKRALRNLEQFEDEESKLTIKVFYENNDRVKKNDAWVSSNKLRTRNESFPPFLVESFS